MRARSRLARSAAAGGLFSLNRADRPLRTGLRILRCCRGLYNLIVAVLGAQELVHREREHAHDARANRAELGLGGSRGAASAGRSKPCSFLQVAGPEGRLADDVRLGCERTSAVLGCASLRLVCTMYDTHIARSDIKFQDPVNQHRLSVCIAKNLCVAEMRGHAQLQKQMNGVLQCVRRRPHCSHPVAPPSVTARSSINSGRAGHTVAASQHGDRVQRTC